jgi:hypothetical protein
MIPESESELKNMDDVVDVDILGCDLKPYDINERIHH